MATLGPLKQAVTDAEQKLAAAKRRLEDADHESDTLTKGLERLAAERDALLKRSAAGEDVEKELADNRGWIRDGQDQLEDFEKRRPYLRNHIAEAEGALEAARHFLALEQSKRVQTNVMSRLENLRAAEDAFLLAWRQVRAEVDQYAELGGVDRGWSQAQNTVLYQTLTHRPALDEPYEIVASHLARQRENPAGSLIPRVLQGSNREATNVYDGWFLKVRDPRPAGAHEQQQTETEAA
jgi:chromosome segregation ATPase